MSSQDIFIIISASIIGLIYLLIIRNYDIYEKEPFLKLLMVAIFGGAISVGSSLIIYRFVDVQHTFIDAVFKIGPIEEISKLLALIIIYRFIKSDFNEIVDGLIYIAAISLGFSIIENIFYAFHSSDPFLILFQRSIFSVLGHISFSGYLGLAYFIHVKVKRNLWGVILSIFIAALAHGLYDALLFQKELNFLFRFAFYLIIAMQFVLFKVVLGFSSYRRKLSLELFEPIDKTVFLKCYHCNSSIKDKGLKFWKITGVVCNSCHCLVLQGENVLSMFKYFRPILSVEKYFKDLSKKNKIVYLDDNEKVTYNSQRTILCSTVPELSEWLIKSNIEDRKKILDIPLIGNLLWFLGIRYLYDE